MIDTDNGWLVGDDGVLKKTTNNWQSSSDPINPPSTFACGNDPDDAYNIHFFMDSGPSPAVPFSKGVLVSDYRRIYTTADSGSSWTQVTVPPGNCPLESGIIELWGLAFDDPLDHTSSGWAVGGVGTNNGYVFRTPDGGQTWSRSRCFQFLLPLPSELSSTCGPSTVYAVAALGTSEPTAIFGAYGAQVFSYETGTSNFNGCDGNCGPGIPAGCGTGSADTWVQVPVPDSLDPCVVLPRLTGASRMSSTKACLTGQFGRIVIFDDNASPNPDYS